MLSSEFQTELGTLIRSLMQRVGTEPTVRVGTQRDALDHIERAIITLVELHISLRRPDL